MSLHSREIAASALFALVAGAAVWPPVEGLLYWTALGALGDAVLVPVGLLAALLGAGFARTIPVAPRSFALGATGAYLVGMGVVEWWLGPDSPVHLLLYGVVLIGLAVGVGLVTVADEQREDDATEPETDPGDTA
jgi:hypothetical protein